MKKSHHLSIFLVITIAICGRAAVCDSRDDADRWQKQTATNELLDRQKILLEKQEKLAAHAHELKHAINQLSTDLSNTQSDLSDVRRELIIVRVKLLP